MSKKIGNIILSVINILSILLIAWFIISWFNVITHNTIPNSTYTYPAWNLFCILFK